jgi:crotonobetainyl-CoA:carnitine CoA-transferase CaiB-like acyl-CoA transferase
VFDTADGGWVAVVGPAQCRSIVDRSGELSTAEVVAAVADGGGQAVEILDPWTAPAAEPLASMLETVDHPVTGPVRHIASPYVVDGVRPASVGPAPLFDQHTDEVIARLAGYGPERLAQLRADEVIGGELPTPESMGYRF